MVVKILTNNRLQEVQAAAPLNSPRGFTAPLFWSHARGHELGALTLSLSIISSKPPEPPALLFS